MSREQMLSQTLNNLRTLFNVGNESYGKFDLNVKLDNLNAEQRVLLLDVLDNIRLGTKNGLGNSINVEVNE
jgi:hypothetical protein